MYWWGGRAQLTEDQYVTTYSVSERSILDPDALVVLTYNLGWMSGMTNNLPIARTDSMYKSHLQQVKHILRQIDPHILGLQEVDFKSRRSRYWQQADSLSDALHIPFRANAVNWDKRYVPFPYWPPSLQFGAMLSGQSTLSQLPILDHKREVLPMPPQ
ncbi:MAG: endonuclease/exonuclease/phosphatase, partial [Phototrophicales bacterium]